MSSNQHPLSTIQLLQTELRSLCVSSPPSLQTSPIHVPKSVSLIQQQQQNSNQSASSSSGSGGSASTSGHVPQSPPPHNPLQMISEESLINLSSQSNQHLVQHNSDNNNKRISMMSPSSLPTSPLPFLGLTFTPPQSFRTSPAGSPVPPAILNSPQLFQSSVGSSCNPSSTAQQIMAQTLLQHQQQLELSIATHGQNRSYVRHNPYDTRKSSSPSPGVMGSSIVTGGVTGPSSSSSTANMAPAISVTDELGTAHHFPILPPPHAFAHYSQPNLQHQTMRMTLDE